MEEEVKKKKRYTLTVIFSHDMQEVLMLKRFKNPYEGRLNGIGGKIEEGETPEQATFREIEEETGITTFLMSKFVPMMEVRFANEVEMHVSYCILLNSPIHRKTPEASSEGVLKWVNVRDLVDVNDQSVAGEGNIPYFITFALFEEGLSYKSR